MIDPGWLILVGFFAAVLGLFAGCLWGIELHEQEAVEKGHAHYDPKTRKFTWNDEVTK